MPVMLYNIINFFKKLIIETKILLFRRMTSEENR